MFPPSLGQHLRGSGDRVCGCSYGLRLQGRAEVEGGLVAEEVVVPATCLVTAGGGAGGLVCGGVLGVAGGGAVGQAEDVVAVVLDGDGLAAPVSGRVLIARWMAEKPGEVVGGLLGELGGGVVDLVAEGRVDAVEAQA